MLGGVWIPIHVVPEQARVALLIACDPHILARAWMLTRDQVTGEVRVGVSETKGPNDRVSITPFVGESDQVRLTFDVAQACDGDPGSDRGPSCRPRTSTLMIVFRYGTTVAFEALDRERATQEHGSTETASLFVIVTAYRIRSDDDLRRVAQLRAIDVRLAQDREALVVHPSDLPPLRIGPTSRGLLAEIRDAQLPRLQKKKTDRPRLPQ
jgi:hypothetical protein